MHEIFENGLEVDENNDTITINYEVFQYPNNVVYIRNSYKELWNYFKGQIYNNCVKRIDEEVLRSTIEKKNELLKVLKSMIKDESNNAFLLRGNPGLGKTSFIIYFLYKLNQYRINEKIFDLLFNEIRKKKSLLINDIKLIENRINKHITIAYYKNTNNGYAEYILNNEGKLVRESLPSPDIIITDSYNLEKKIGTLLVLYVSSPDMKSYKNFYDYGESERKCLYLDVFSPTEIEDWIKKCLPGDLGNYIRENNVAKRYGYVPRHIYFDAVYSFYYNRSYWDEIYCNGLIFKY